MNLVTLGSLGYFTTALLIWTLHFEFSQRWELAWGHADVNNHKQWPNCHDTAGPLWWEVKVTVRLCGGCVCLWESASLFMGSRNDSSLFPCHVSMIDAASLVLTPCFWHASSSPRGTASVRSQIWGQTVCVCHYFRSHCLWLLVSYLLLDQKMILSRCDWRLIIIIMISNRVLRLRSSIWRGDILSVLIWCMRGRWSQD